MKKKGNGLNPLEYSQDDFDALPGGELQVTIKKLRNPAFHRKFYKLMRLVYNSQDHYKKIEHLIQFFKRHTGLFVLVEDHLGNKEPVYDSLAFDKLDDIAFGTFYNACVTLAFQIVGVEESELRRQVEFF